MKKILAILLCMSVLAGCFPSKTGVVHSSAEDAISALESKDDIRITEVYMDDEDPVIDDSTKRKTYPEYEKLEQYIGVVAGTPTVYFIKEGVIKGMFTGAVSYDTFRDKIDKYGFLPKAE